MRLTLRQAAQQGILPRSLKIVITVTIGLSSLPIDPRSRSGMWFNLRGGFPRSLGVGRKLAIQILEYFDRIGFRVVVEMIIYCATHYYFRKNKK